jgi:hypothetical protein
LHHNPVGRTRRASMRAMAGVALRFPCISDAEQKPCTQHHPGHCGLDCRRADVVGLFVGRLNPQWQRRCSLITRTYHARLAPAAHLETVLLAEARPAGGHASGSSGSAALFLANVPPAGVSNRSDIHHVRRVFCWKKLIRAASHCSSPCRERVTSSARVNARVCRPSLLGGLRCGLHMIIEGPWA